MVTCAPLTGRRWATCGASTVIGEVPAGGRMKPVTVTTRWAAGAVAMSELATAR